MSLLRNQKESNNNWEGHSITIERCHRFFPLQSRSFSAIHNSAWRDESFENIHCCVVDIVGHCTYAYASKSLCAKIDWRIMSAFLPSHVHNRVLAFLCGAISKPFGQNEIACESEGYVYFAVVDVDNSRRNYCNIFCVANSDMQYILSSIVVPCEQRPKRIQKRICRMRWTNTTPIICMRLALFIRHVPDEIRRCFRHADRAINRQSSSAAVGGN